MPQRTTDISFNEVLNRLIEAKTPRLIALTIKNYIKYYYLPRHARNRAEKKNPLKIEPYDDFSMHLPAKCSHSY